MKTDIITSISIAIIGCILGFVVCNMFFGEIEDVTYKTVNSDVNASLVNPNESMFNVNSLNPTVEVYVGECKEIDVYGNCVEGNE